MSEDNFKWNDELVKEFAVWAFSNRRLIASDSAFIEQFKAEKTKAKDYEILEFEPGNCITTYPPKFQEGKIKKVKRLSDGEIFTVGDKITWTKYYFTASFHIKEFVVGGGYDGTMLVRYIQDEDENNNSGWLLRDIEKVKQPIPLFTTEDGKEIFKGDLVWMVRKDLSLPATWLKVCDYPSKDLIFFSTEAAAKEYILLNKPCLSVNDVISKYGFIISKGDLSYFNDELKQLAKSKIDKQ